MIHKKLSIRALIILVVGIVLAIVIHNPRKQNTETEQESSSASKQKSSSTSITSSTSKKKPEDSSSQLDSPATGYLFLTILYPILGLCPGRYRAIPRLKYADGLPVLPLAKPLTDHRFRAVVTPKKLDRMSRLEKAEILLHLL